MKTLIEAPVTLGTDPEYFLSRRGKIIGSEKIIPEKGLIDQYLKYVVRDGVQIELHPPCATTVPFVGKNLSKAFKVLKNHLAASPTVKVSFAPVVDVSEKELASLAEESRILGCAPSENWYGLPRLSVPEGTQPPRSAGGHIHVGLTAPIYERVGNDHRRSLTPLMDILVGNTGVLLDREPRAAERRKLYGRAGEFRLPEHGLEYRTLSNFWTRSYPLMELMMGLSLTAVSVLHTSLLGSGDPEGEIAGSIDLNKVVKAIMDNDRDLAYENWKTVTRFLAKWVPTDNPKFPLNANNLEKFDNFISMVAEKNLDAFLPADPVEHWINLDTTHGWHDFISRT